MQEDSLFSTPSPAFIVCSVFDDGHSDHCEVISHCSFDLHFSNNKASLVAQMVKCLSAMQETRVRSLGWEDPLEKEMAVFLPGKSHGRRLQSMGSQRVGLSDVTFTFYASSKINFAFDDI